MVLSCLRVGFGVRVYLGSFKGLVADLFKGLFQILFRLGLRSMYGWFRTYVGLV